VRKEPPQAGGVVGGVREGRRNPATRILPASYSRCTQQQRMEQTGHRTPTKCGSRVVWGPAVRWVLLCGSARELIKVRGAHVASPRLAALHPLSWCARATVTKGLQRTTGTAGLERTAAGSARTLPSPACLPFGLASRPPVRPLLDLPAALSQPPNQRWGPTAASLSPSPSRRSVPPPPYQSSVLATTDRPRQRGFGGLPLFRAGDVSVSAGWA
jgi:hypothetical protein